MPVERSGEPLVGDRRFAAPYEELRDAADAADDPPRIYLAQLGPPGAATARANFAKSLFEAGGVRAVTDGDFADSGARNAVLCSSDEVYEAEVATAAPALKEAGCEHLYLAGRPRDDYERAGVDAFVHARSDRLAVLRDLHERLGLR